MSRDALISDGQRPAGLIPGLDVLGAFHLLRPLGTGGMACVWLAVDARSGRQVAIKRMLPRIVADAELRRAFVEEAELGLRLRHPNIVETLELGEVTTATGVEPYLVLELLQGRPLIDLLRAAGRRRIPVPLGFAVRAIVDAARALDHAHKIVNPDGRTLGLVHRDVSPHNLFACADGHIKLLDFGIAKTSSQQHRTGTGLIKGKLAYLSPEQIRGEGADARVDVFALGIVLHEMLVGRPLFRGGNEAETLHRVLSQHVLPPDEVRPDVPPGLSAIALRALQRDRDRRLPSASAFADAVEAVAEATGIHCTRTDVRAFAGELFPKDAHTQAEDSALARRTYEYLSSSSLRAITSDPWLTPAEGVRQAEQPPSRAPLLRNSALLAGALAVTCFAAFTTTNFLRRIMTPPASTNGVEAVAGRSPAARPLHDRTDPNTPPPSTPPSAPWSKADSIDSGSIRSIELAAPAPMLAPRTPTRRESSHHNERARTPQGGGQGRLRVAAHPWAEVSIDGRSVGTTPLRTTEIHEGKHTIVFANAELRVSVQRRVMIRPDQETVVIVDLFRERARAR